MNELYAQGRLQINYFLPSMKLVEKVRVGSRVTKKYDEARTPYQRLLESGILTVEEVAKAENKFLILNPVAIQ